VENTDSSMGIANPKQFGAGLQIGHSGVESI